MVDERLYYLCRVRINETTVFVVWFTDERDSFARDESDHLLTAATPEALAAVAGAMGNPLMDEEPADYDFDRIRAWCAAPEASEIACSTFLNAWNFFDDLAGLHDGADTPYARLSRGAASCYDRLFRGCNLPAITPPGEWFEPEWRADELTDIRNVLNAGIRLLEEELMARN